MQIDSEEQPMMHGRVHPSAATSSSSDVDYSGEMNQSAVSDASSSPLYSFHFEKPLPPPNQHPGSGTGGAYVVQVPKDKVFRVPPPENARLFDHYTRRATRRRARSCTRVCACLLAGTAFLALLGAALTAVAFLVLRPKNPAFTVQALAVSGLSSNTSSSSPAFNATVRAENPNGRIGLRYEPGNRVAVSYAGVLLADGGGAWSEFYQGPRNVTLFVAKARASGGMIRFAESVRAQMAAAERRGSVPFDVDVEVRVRMLLGGKVGSWALPVRARCIVAVDRLAADAKVVSSSRSCDVKVRLLSWWM